MTSRIAIIGTGLVGTSIGLGLKKAKVGYEIVGHDKDPGRAGKAKQRGAVDRTEWNLISAIEDAGLVILTIPVDGIKPTLEAIAPYLQEGCVVTDTASVKGQVLAWAEEILPQHVQFVGGHPLISAEGTGPDAANADLFSNATYCLIPARYTQPQAVELLAGLAATLGAKPFFLDAVEHDNFMAAVSHLPIFMAAALMNIVAQSPSWREIRRLAGGDFRRATALAAEEPAATSLLCAVNRNGILRWLDAYIAELSRLRGLIAAGSADLKTAFQQAADSHALWLRAPAEEGLPAIPEGLVSPGEQVRRLFLGELGKRKR